MLCFGNKLNKEVCCRFIFANLFNLLYPLVRLWWNILVANLATNFQDWVAKVKNVVTLVSVLRCYFTPCPMYFGLTDLIIIWATDIWYCYPVIVLKPAFQFVPCIFIVHIIKRKLRINPKILILCYHGTNNISLMRYYSCYLKIKLISSCHHVISSLYSPHCSLYIF